jgi:hypothetical protein
MDFGLIGITQRLLQSLGKKIYQKQKTAVGTD